MKHKIKPMQDLVEAWIIKNYGKSNPALFRYNLEEKIKEISHQFCKLKSMDGHYIHHKMRIELRKFANMQIQKRTYTQKGGVPPPAKNRNNYF